MWKLRNTLKSMPISDPSIASQADVLSTRIKSIQAQMTARALELLQLPEDEVAFLLDIGCGSGLSGEMLDEEGHVWVGCDIAPSMLGKWGS